MAKGNGVIRHFLDLDQFTGAHLRKLIEAGKRYKKTAASKRAAKPLAGKTLALIFDKPSTRTRVSFEVGMRQLGGDVVVLNATDMQLGRGETVADTARVLSRYVDAIVLRTGEEAKLHELAHFASVPVINGLTSRSHPCQILADVMTFEERRGLIKGKTLAWSGDCNNVARSLIHAAARLHFKLRMACPEEFGPDEATRAWAQANKCDLLLTEDPASAVKGADCVMTDTWVSMSDTDAKRRHNLLMPFQVNERLMALAKKDAIFMHCLPAHRGEEVTAAVIDGPQSVVFDEAENRTHAQKAVLSWCLLGA
jgi:ornithine carbamoyltransferase